MNKGKKLIYVILSISIVLWGGTQIRIYSRNMNTSNSTGLCYDNTMKDTLADIDTRIINEAKFIYGGALVNTPTVKTTYSTYKVGTKNISQTRMNLYWNNRHTSQKVDGTCAAVAMTMLIRKYADVGQLKETKDEDVFCTLIAYAWSTGIFSGKSDSGLTDNEIKKMANNYLNKYQNGKYTANVDIANCWGTLKKYCNDNIKPIQLHLTGKTTDHSVVANAGYCETVSFVIRSTDGMYKNNTINYNIARICDGWNDSSSSSTYKYIFMDSVESLVKLK